MRYGKHWLNSAESGQGRTAAVRNHDVKKCSRRRIPPATAFLWSQSASSLKRNRFSRYVTCIIRCQEYADTSDILLRVCKPFKRNTLNRLIIQFGIFIFPFLQTWCHGQRAYYIHIDAIFTPFCSSYTGHSLWQPRRKTGPVFRTDRLRMRS